MKKNKIILVFAIAAVFFTFTLSVFAKGTADVSLSFGKSSFLSNDGVMVDVTITNNSKSTIKLLKWYTPIDGVEEPLFALRRDGQDVEYIGAHYKRPQPTDADYFRLRAGESITRTVNLADYYDFSVSGEYAINFDVAALNLFQKGSALSNQTEGLKSGTGIVFVEGRAAKIPEPVTPAAVSGSSSFTAKCTASQQSSILTARNDAAIYSSNALTYLQSGTAGARYTTWFGVYNASRYSTVTSHFSAIKNAMETSSMTFDCGCKKRYYAYVYPNQPYTIYLCSVYWQAPQTGTDSKAGTLVHETSHFTVVAGTDDWVYGQSGAQSLAISDPVKAIDNADSHEYFAENTPFNP